MRGDLEHRLVPHDAAARQIALLCRLFAPCRQRTEHAEEFAVGAAADAKTAPRFGRVAAINGGIDELAHFLGKPGGATILGQEMLQPVVDRAQMHDIGERIIDLPLGERPVRPIGKARGLVEGRAGEALDQGFVADRVAKAAHHRRDLRVEGRVWHLARQLEEDFEILTRGVEHFEDLRVGHQRQERLQIHALGQGVDRDRLPGAGHLHDAEDRPKGALAHELGIDGDELRVFLPGAKRLHGGAVRDQAHWRGYSIERRAAKAPRPKAKPLDRPEFAQTPRRLSRQ